MKTIKFMILIVLSTSLLAGCSKEEQILSFVTGSSAGTYYPIGSSIAQTISDSIDNVIVNSYPGNASVANCTLLGSGETDMALIQNNIGYFAYSGINQFENQAIPELRAIASLYGEAVQIIALKSSNIHSVADLKGKKVNIGPKDSGVVTDAYNIFNIYNLREDEMEIFHYAFEQARALLEEGTIDAAFVTAGFPTASITNTCVAADVVLINIEEDKRDELIERSPYYAKTRIPGGTYPTIDQDIETITLMAMWVTTTDLDDQLVYEMTQALWDNVEDLQYSHAIGKDVTLETSLEAMSIPLHDGAKAYYDEKMD